MKITYKIPLIKQGIKECVQASASQILSYYGIEKTIDQVKQEVPVYVDATGVIRGTSLGHIATYFQKLGLKTTLHTSDIIIFDPTWKNLNSEKLIQKLTLRQPFIQHGWYDQETLITIVDGYIQYLKKHGTITLSIIDVSYLLQYLQQGPIFMSVSYNVLNHCAKYDFSKTNTPDDIKGLPSTHAIIISGYKDGFFDVVDPDFEFGGYRKISESQLIAAYYLAQTDMDSLFISLKK